MSAKTSTPKALNLVGLMAKYGTEAKCREYLEQLRWPDGVTCPKCGGKSVSRIATRSIYECNNRSCTQQFSVRVGSVLQDSKLPLWKWFMATFLIVESKKGISANQLRRMLGTTYRTSWFLSHRIREAMIAASDGAPLTGTVEVDEAYIGGRPRHPRKRRGRNPDYPKTMVLGAVERGGNIRLRVEKRGPNMATVRQFLAKNVDEAAPFLYTDSSPVYGDLNDTDTKHESVNHSAMEWVRGDVHTNSVEGVWSLLKRSIVGSYHHLSVKHLQGYLDEIEWRFNNRHNDYLFRDTLKALFRSEAMTYRKLIERPA